MNDKFVITYSYVEEHVGNSWDFVRTIQTDDIEKWEYEMLEHIKKFKASDQSKDMLYKGIEIYFRNFEHSYQIFTLEDWFKKNLVV